MSSYRSYRPWNSSLSSYSSSSSNYRSRYGTDASSSLSSSSASSAKFSSITPSSYRPSYSSTSGTYRASRAPAVSTTSTTPSYTRTYSTLGKTTDDDKEKSSKTTPSYSRAYTSLGKSSTDDDKDKSSKASTPSYSRTYTSLGKSNTDDDKDKPTRTYTRTYTSSLSKTNHDNEKEKEKKEPSPPKRTTSRLSVKDLSAETKSRLSTAYTASPAKKEEKGPPITFNTRYKQTSSSSIRGRSRDPSPAADTTTGQTALQRISAQRSRDPSPSISAYSRLSAARSRDPSPVSKSYTDSTDNKSSLSRTSVDRNPVNRTYSNSLHVNNSKSPSDKSLNRTLSSSLSSTLEKLDREIKSTLTNAREKSRDPSPLNTRRPSITSITSSFPRSRDPSPVSDNKYLLSSYRITNGKDNKSREPSPSISLSKSKLRESSPLASISNYRRPSREPSPVESLSKYGSTTSGFSTNSSYNRTSYREPSPQIKLPDIGLSYMTTSESVAANAARASRISFINRHSPQKEATPPKIAIPVISCKKQESESESSETSSSEEETTDSSSEESEEEERKPEPKIMIQVSTITRGTSPNPPGQTQRSSRRIEVAKTIEKVRERPLNNPPMLDKATQSDRMDDSTRYSKYGSTIRSPYSPYSPSPTTYSSRYTSGITSSRYTREQSEVSNADTEKSEASQKSDKFNFALSKSKEGSPVKSDTSRSSSLIKSPSPSKICVSKDRNRTSSMSSAKSKTPESSKALPPQSPKAESPVKMSSPKVTNKDFRKSALNMGPTDRQTRSKSSSSDNSSPTVEKTRQQFQKMLNGEQKEEVPRRSIERSVSVESDTSTESTESVEMQSQIQQPQFELSKEDKITAKVEEAKSFLLKTLGNPTFSIKKSPTPETWVEESSSAIPETEYSESTNLTKDEVLTTQPTMEEKKPWWAIDDTADDASAIENDITLTSGVGTTLEQDNSNQIVNGFSEMTLNPSDNQSDNFTSKWSLNEIQSLKSIQRVDSGDRPWWCTSPENKAAAVASENQAIAQNNENTAVSNMWEQETQADVSEIQKDDEIQDITKNLQQSFDANALGDRASPEGLEDRRSPYDNVMQQQQQSINNAAYRIENDFNARPRLFISRHTNIDDLLGGHSVFSPTAMDRPYLEMITPDLVRIHDSNSPPKIVLNKNKSAATATAENDHQQVGALPQKLDDAAIQVYKDGDFGAYLDLESSLVEQSEEIEGLNTSRKNSLVVRTQLSVRVHAIIEKLLTSEGRELRRALFSLKQIFQEDKDLVHGFVGLGGLNCLVQIGSEADQNYQNYILRALGQVMLYVDGMNGVMKHGPTVQWLYTLIASKYRLVVKTALKLLLVFVEYCEGNCYLLVNAIRTVDIARGSLPWTNIMKLLKDYDNADTELLIYATSLINKTLSGLSDQDSFYDESDFLEQQGMESIIQRYMSRTGTDLDLLDQFQLYEAALRFEDGESDEIIRLPDNTVRKTLRLRSSDSTERRKSRRHSTGTAPPPAPPPIPTYNIVPPVVPPLPLNYMIQQQKKEQDDNDDSSSSGGGGDLNGFADCKVREGVAGVTPGLRRRRERAERQKSFQREQEAVVNGTTKNGGVESDDYGKHKHPLVSNNINSNNNHFNGIIKECDNHQVNEQQQQQHQYIINNNNRTSVISNGTSTTNHIYNGSNHDMNNSNSNNHLILNNNNNKNDYSNNNNSIVTNKKLYHHLNHHHITNNNNNVLCNNNQNGVSKSVILNYDKNTLEYKNNKNLILNRHQNINNNKVDINGNNTTTTNNYNSPSHNGYANNHHQIYEKHLNGINQLKNELQSTKRFIITTQAPTSGTTNGVENCENNQKSNKFHINIAKNHRNHHQNGTSVTQQQPPSIDETDNVMQQQHHPITNGIMKNRLITSAAISDKDNGSGNGNDTTNVLENIPANVNIHKVNGHLNGLNLNSNGHHHHLHNGNSIKNGHSGTVKVTEISNAYQNGKHADSTISNGHATRNGYHHEQSHKTNGFIRNCSHNTNGNNNGRSNDFSTIKINYVSRQIVGRGQPTTNSTMTTPTLATSNGNTVSSTNGHATNGNSHCNSINTSNNNHFHHGTVSLHDNPKNTTGATNIPNIPNIVINGSNDGTSINGDYEPRKDEEILKKKNDTENEDKKLLQQLKREQTVKDLTQKLSNLPLSPQEEKPSRVGDMSGLISKAKEELNKSKNKVDVKTNVENDLKKPEPKKSEIELHWEELMKNMDRDLILCDLDFRDLNEEDEINVLTPRGINGSSIPPPPPAMMGGLINPLGNLVPPPMLRPNGLVNGNSPKDSSNNDLNGLTLKKTKKTVKLFWKEVREDMIPTTIERTIWDELPPSNVDTLKLEHLFESRAKDLLTKKQQETNKNKEIIVLDHKRSNAINIAMTKLPPPRAIKAAILKMDSTVVTREGIEKLLNMLPTDEERGKIQEAQMLSPELPLGSAEQFLLTLSSISELPARLKLWAFKLDFENLEKEIAEPLMDLKQGVELLKTNLTFKCILSTLLSIGCFLNGQPVKGFQIEYLAKVPEVKDTVHKHSLLHHLCHMVMESQSNTTDLYSEIGPITRASKADFNELAHNIKYLETECKASWDRLKLISKHDTAPQLKQKLIDFLADCAERIIILDVVHRRVINRYHKFLLWLGIPPHRIAESRPNEFCRILSEFALEYRTTRERVHQQIEKKANHRERNKTRGKLIIDVPKFKNGNVVPVTKEENSKDEELRQLLGTTDGSETAEINGTFTFRRRRPETQRSPSVTARDESFTDADDEIFESLVKTVTKTATPRPVQRERKRTRNADRKSLRRTLRNGLTEEEQHHIQQLIQGY